MGIAIFIILYIILGLIITSFALSDSVHLDDMSDKIALGFAGTAFTFMWPIVLVVLLVGTILAWIIKRIQR